MIAGMLNKKIKFTNNEITKALNVHKKAFSSIVIFSFVINFLYLTPAIYMMQVYDRVIISRSPFTLLFLSMLCFGLCALLVFLDYIRSQVLIRINNSLDEFLSKRVFDASFEANLKKADLNTFGGLSDLQQLRSFITGTGLFGFLDAPWIPIYLIVVFMLHPLLGFFALMGALVLIGLTFINERTTKNALSISNSNNQLATMYSSGALRNADAIQSMGMLSALQKKWYEFQYKVLKHQTIASQRSAVISNLSKLTRLIVQSGVLGIGAYLVINNQATPGIMIAASVLVGRALAPVELLISSWKSFDSARFSYGRLLNLLDCFPVKLKQISLPAPEGQVSIQNVFITPPNSTLNVIKGLSLNLSPGQVYGLIGPTGSGKSTLAKALVGVWQPYSGVIRLDGAELNQWNLDELGPHVGYLPQDIELFRGTIAENISRFQSVDSEKIVEAASKAGVHEMILGMPEGYQTQLGDGGNVLSAGQRQRIGLARALYGSPALIVLDEPNSNLDDEGEKALVEAIKTMKQLLKTIVVITHRTTILSAIDHLVILKNGSIVISGPTSEILQKMKATTQS